VGVELTYPIFILDGDACYTHKRTFFPTPSALKESLICDGEAYAERRSHIIGGSRTGEPHMGHEVSEVGLLAGAASCQHSDANNGPLLADLSSSVIYTPHAHRQWFQGTKSLRRKWRALFFALGLPRQLNNSKALILRALVSTSWTTYWTTLPP
jgi:hypothetical protein